MGARANLSVILIASNNEELAVKYDHDADEDSAVDIIGPGGRLFSCSLADVEEFAALLVEFVQHHAEPVDVEDGGDGE